MSVRVAPDRLPGLRGMEDHRHVVHLPVALAFQAQTPLGGGAEEVGVAAAVPGGAGVLREKAFVPAPMRNAHARTKKGLTHDGGGM